MLNIQVGITNLSAAPITNISLPVTYFIFIPNVSVFSKTIQCDATEKLNSRQATGNIEPFF